MKALAIIVGTLLAISLGATAPPKPSPFVPIPGLAGWYLSAGTESITVDRYGVLVTYTLGTADPTCDQKGLWETVGGVLVLVDVQCSKLIGCKKQCVKVSQPTGPGAVTIWCDCQ